MGRLKGGHNFKEQICSYCGKNEIKARGLCNACYIRWQRYGNCDYRRAKKTNADRIRSMTDEELAKWLNHMQANAYNRGMLEDWIVGYPNNYGAWLDWLMQEAETCS